MWEFSIFLFIGQLTPSLMGLIVHTGIMSRPAIAFVGTGKPFHHGMKLTFQQLHTEQSGRQLGFFKECLRHGEVFVEIEESKLNELRIQFVNEQRLPGIGNSIQRVAKRTGIERIILWLRQQFGFDCGCERRRLWLNRLMPYRKL